MDRATGPERVVVINDDAVEQGGAATIALAVARAIAKRGIPVTFLSGGGPIAPDLAVCEIATISLGGRQSLARAIARRLDDDLLARRMSCQPSDRQGAATGADPCAVVRRAVVAMRRMSSRPRSRARRGRAGNTGSPRRRGRRLNCPRRP